MSYPNIGDLDFYNKIYGKKEFNENIQKIPGIKQEPYQQFVRKYINKSTDYDSLFLYWNLGAGKCLKKDTLILMADGKFKKVQDIQIGDLVMGDDNNPRKVLNLSRGTGDMFDIFQKKGQKYTVNSEHILSLKRTCEKTIHIQKEKNYQFYIIKWYEKGLEKIKTFSIHDKVQAENFFTEKVNDPYIDISIKDYLSLPNKIKSQLKGYKKVIDFPEKQIYADPYLLGYWLADDKGHNFSTEIYPWNDENILLDDNHIPENYKYNSKEIRLKLLAGLIDSGASLNCNGFEFCYANDKLLDDILYLGRSLGFYCQKLSSNFFGNKKSKVVIKGDLNQIPILNKDKKPRQENKVDLSTHISVKYIGIDDYYGFELDGNHRFLLEDFTVTHNSMGSISITENFRELVAQKDGLDKFLIITKSKTLQNVYRRELAKFFYASERELQLVNQGNKNTIKTIRQRINNYYEFINYDELTNRVIGQVKTSEMTEKRRRDIKEEKAITNFDNRIVVIDEIQNLTGNYRYLSIFKTLRNSKNVRLILLSATPMTNSTDEMIYIANLLNWKNPPFNLNEEKLQLTEQSNIQLEKALKSLYKDGILEISKIKIEDEMDKKEETEKVISVFTSIGEKILLESLRGKISYQPLDPVNFPKKIRMGEPITNKPGSLKVFKCPMSPYQKMAYLYAKENNSGSFYGNLSEICTIAYEGLDAQEANDNKNLFRTSLKEQSLYRYSSKLYTILKNIQKSPGICFIYSNFVENGGTKLVAEMLRQNGYVPYSDKNPNPNSYVLYNDKLSETERAEYEKIINSKENINGKKIRIIIGSPLIAEGLSFFNVRQIHILDPHWNLTRILQAEGRCIRNFSHNLLEPKDRNVSIYWYVSTFDDNQETVDQIKYLICEEKDRSIKNMERKIKKIAIDCYNSKQIISKKRISNEKAYQDYYQDFSPECDYQNCEYQCDYIDEDKIKNYQKQDLSLTYNKDTDPYQISLAKKLIKRLFEYNDVYKIEMIEDTLSESGLNNYNIFWALNELVSNKERFLIPNKGLNYIDYIKKYYKLVRIESENKKEPKNINQFLNSYLPEVGPSNINKIQKKVKSEDNPVISKLYSISEFAEKTGSDIIGLIEEGIFKIVDLNKNKKQGTNRDFSRGKQCLFFDKKSLDDFARRLGLQVSGNKSNYCSAILKELEKRKLVINLDD